LSPITAREKHFSPLKYISIPWKTIGEERRTKNASGGELCYTFGVLLVLVLVLDD
jgi:hypothetical protein